jgi:hypothetical protein
MHLLVLLPEHGSPRKLSRLETVVEVALALGVEEKEDLIWVRAKNKANNFSVFQLISSQCTIMTGDPRSLLESLNGQI